MIKLGLALSVVGFAVMAQESTSAIPRNDTALRNAIAGLGKRPLPLVPQQVRMAPATTGACSVSRQMMPPPETEKFTIRQVPAPTVERMPNVAVPAPACETAAP